MDDRILTVAEVAAYLKLSKSKTYYMIANKELPHIRIGKNVRIRESDLIKWMQIQTVPAQLH